MELNNQQLIKTLKRCSRGNRKAQEHLYSNYYSYAMSIALRYSGSFNEAEEITNDSFYKVFIKLEKHNLEKSFKAWLRKIVINTALDHYRTNQKSKNLVLLEDTQDIYFGDDTLEDINAEEILELLQSLSPMYRLVFNLYIIEGYNHDEIATKLSITASTSRSNLARAKQKLRELLTKSQYYEKAR